LLEALSVALDLSEEEAVYFGRSRVDSGDLLIGLAASKADTVARALDALGLNVDAAAGDKARVDG
jgi:hypothetical protein